MPMSETRRTLRDECRGRIRDRNLARDEKEEQRILTWLFEPTHPATEWHDDFRRLVKFLQGDVKRADLVVAAFQYN
jgi:hypothetical protein